MKLQKLTIPFLFFLCLQVFAYENDMDVLSYEKIDPVVPNKEWVKFHNDFVRLEKGNFLRKVPADTISSDRLKDSAINALITGDTDKSLQYLESYIRKEHDVTILYDPTFAALKETKEYQRIEKMFLFELNGWILFFFATGLIGIFLSAVINLRKKGDTSANLMISLFVFFHSIFIIHLCMYLSKSSFNVPHSLYISTWFSFLYGPLLYFYYKRITQKYKFKVLDLLHLVPSIILVIYLLPIYSLSGEEKLHLMYNRDQILLPMLTNIVVVKYLSLGTYAYLIYRIYAKKLNERKKGINPQIIKWQRNLMILNALYVVFYVVYGVAIMNNVVTHLLLYPQVFLMSSIILYVGYIAYVQPTVFSKKFLFGKLTLEKYQKSGLTDSFSIELKEQLLELFAEEKIYKESNISLGILAQRLGTTRHNISQVINEHFDLNFFHLINKYRIEEAKEIFKNDQNRNLNIIDVAYDVGFNNKVTFNKAFKAETNMTPSLYLRSLT